MPIFLRLILRFCPYGVLAGLHGDGCFSEYFLAMAHNTVKIPNNIPFEQVCGVSGIDSRLYQH